MTIFRMTFAGEVKKADHKEAGGKKLVELSICKKNRGKQGDPDTFTWLRVAVWEPAAFQVPKMVKGCFIAGSGEVQLRSYEGKDGKASSLECRCTSFDIEVTDGSPHSPAPEERRPTRSAAPIVDNGGDDEPPF